MKKVTAILLGAGHRGADAYATYALKFPNELQFVGVAEPRKDRRDEFALAHKISAENCVADWKELLSRPKMADCVFICTQDKMHFEPLNAAMEKGYDILCEKPITPVKSELIKLRELAKNYAGTISVCHVLRYSPFFTKIKSLLDSGAVGKLVNIQHMECVGFWHMAHSFVRGNWRNTEESSPMILAKCCHDIDIMLWLVGKKCDKVSSFGSLSHFKKENAPKDAPARCMDGCAHRDSCPYYAPRFYLDHPKAEIDGFRRVLCTDSTNDVSVLEALKTSPYGRCVYHCDNDVVDHQVVNMEFSGGVTVNLTMSAFSPRCERVIKLQGTHGEICGWMEDNKIEVSDFSTGNKNIITLNTSEKGHNGSDDAMMKAFTEVMASEGKVKSKIGAIEAIDSHLIALAAEESRIHGGKAVSSRSFYK